MREHLAQLKTRRKYYEDISSERAAREAEAEETERLKVSFFSYLRAQITKLDTFLAGRRVIHFEETLFICVIRYAYLA